VALAHTLLPAKCQFPGQRYELFPVFLRRLRLNADMDAQPQAGIFFPASKDCGFTSTKGDEATKLRLFSAKFLSS